MEQDDVIEVYQEQTGGANANESLIAEDTSPATQETEDKKKTPPCRNVFSEYLNKIFRFRGGYKKYSAIKSRESEMVSYCTKEDDVVRLAPLSL